jgi:hypothetical protein
MKFCRDSLRTTFITVVYHLFKQETKNGESLYSAVLSDERTAKYCCCNEWQFFTASVNVSFLWLNTFRHENPSWLNHNIRRFFFRFSF